jgi:hypothetical protein
MVDYHMTATFVSYVKDYFPEQQKLLSKYGRRSMVIFWVKLQPDFQLSSSRDIS